MWRRPHQVSGVAVALVMVLAGTFSSAYAQDLKNPFAALAFLDASPEGSDASSVTCPAAPAPVRDMDFTVFYSDARATIIDPALLARNKEEVRPLDEFIAVLGGLTARMFELGPVPRAQVAACIISLLGGWADADALLGRSNVQGNGHRRWIGNAMAVAFLVAATQPIQNAETVSGVRAWFGRLGQRIIATSSTLKNNHLYWAAAATAGLGIAADRRTLLDWAIKRLRYGLGGVASNGTLSAELDRGERALQYHAFSLTPLLEVMVFARANGTAFSPSEEASIRRLAGLFMRNGESPAEITSLAKVQQKWNPSAAYATSWMYLYLSLFDDCAVRERMRMYPGKAVYPFLGGEVNRLYPVRHQSAC